MESKVCEEFKSTALYNDCDDLQFQWKACW